jgi:hypothetical protein
MNEDFGMYEDVEATLARLVADLSPESYQRHAPGLQELGLALAERREALREMSRARELQEQALEGYEEAKEGLERAEERTQSALRLLEESL